MDLDLAKSKNEPPSGAPRRMGSTEFMAIELLQGKPQTPRHDLESFMYVLIWLCVERGWQLAGSVPVGQRSSVLQLWQVGENKRIAYMKLGLTSKGGFGKFLEEFHAKLNCVKALCWKLRDIIFADIQTHFLDTESGIDILYDGVIQAFDEELESIRGIGAGSDVALPSTTETRNEGAGGKGKGGVREGGAVRAGGAVREAGGKGDESLPTRATIGTMATGPVVRRRCRHCRHAGHNIRRCPQLQR